MTLMQKQDMVHIRTDRGLWMAGGKGYTDRRGAAGQWPRAQAELMTARLGPEKKVLLIPVAMSICQDCSNSDRCRAAGACQIELVDADSRAVEEAYEPPAFLPCADCGTTHLCAEDRDCLNAPPAGPTQAMKDAAVRYRDRLANRAPAPQLPADAKARKDAPVARGVLDYFPLAILAVAECSRIGNEQHHPGEPMHWARGKSTDQADALVRHLMERGTVDTDGVRHSAKVAWRALALLQEEIEGL